jgi:hypothetical protein
MVSPGFSVCFPLSLFSSLCFPAERIRRVLLVTGLLSERAAQLRRKISWLGKPLGSQFGSPGGGLRAMNTCLQQKNLLTPALAMHLLSRSKISVRRVFSTLRRLSQKKKITHESFSKKTVNFQIQR